MSDQKPRELVLPPGQYAYLQDATKGNIKVLVGPVVINQTNQDAPIVYNDSENRFENCASLAESVRFSPIANEGDYLVLTNPAVGDKRPTEGQQSAPELSIGRRVNVPGPVMFALWPSQTAQVVKGHQLRSNQYLVVRVYNEEEARKNWNRAVVKTATGEAAALVDAPSDLTVGRQLIIKGTEVSFYIPPTGISVVQGPTFSNSTSSEEAYVRDALTLEQLDYCILVDEDGTKRYERGPKVVFPEPTETFISDTKGEIKFRAIELNALQGLHIKVITPYKEGDREFKEGEELFVTGAETQIYYPREEHSLITYDGNQKHFAVAIPPGEARYVMNRMTGLIRTVRGPTMLLPNPVNEVIVRRHLTDREVVALYPNNSDALEYNRTLRAIAEKSPTTRAGVVSEGDIQRNSNSSRDIGGSRGAPVGVAAAAGGFATMDSAAINYMTSNAGGAFATKAVMPKSNINNSKVGKTGDEIIRSSSYTQPRSLVFGSKFEGVPTIKLFTGYAIMIVNAQGSRRVVQGPAVIQLEYDETVEIMSLSTGKPKTADNIYQTPYLRMVNNKVSDIFEVETSDHVRVNLKVSHVVNFEGEANQWFAIENYVKFLCDHIRSLAKAAVKKISIETFYQNATDIIRSIALGGDTDKGFTFPQNGMRLADVEVLDVTILDANVAKLLSDSQRLAVQGNIQVAQATRTLEFTKRQEEINREIAQAQTDTRKRTLTLEQEVVVAELTTQLTKIKSKIDQLTAQQTQVEEEVKLNSIAHAGELEKTAAASKLQLDINSKDIENKITLLKAETAAAVERFAAIQGGLSEALLALSNQDTLVKMAQAHSIQSIVGGESVVDVLSKMFVGTPLEDAVANMATKIKAPLVHGNGKSNGSTAQV